MKATKKTKQTKQAKIDDLTPNQPKAIKGGLNFTKICF
jgi:hypothetical protein